jgi:hypothetical protein
VNEIKVPCPLCDKIEALGALEFSKRLVREFGLDDVLKAVDAPTKVEPAAITPPAPPTAPSGITVAPSVQVPLPPAETVATTLKKASEVMEKNRTLMEICNHGH